MNPPSRILVLGLLLLLTGCTTERVAIPSGPSAPKSTSAGELIPDMSGRPINLIPGEIPWRVRYTFTDDDLVVEAANKLRNLLTGETAMDDGIASVLMVQPGAWGLIKEDPAIQQIPFIPMNAMVSIGGEMTTREGALVREATAGGEILKKVRERVGDNIEVRSLRTMEMAKWWVFIGFDIAEPVFVVQSEDGRYKFIFSYSDGNLFVIDELNTLPDVT